MRIFHCDHCSRPVFFENTLCGNCGNKLAYLPDLKIVGSLDPVKETPGAGELWASPVKRAEGRRYRLCKNYTKHRVCNWALREDESNPLCPSCRLTRVIPDLSVTSNHEAWRRLEIAKRRVVYSLMEFELPLQDRGKDPQRGLEFRFLGDPPPPALVSAAAMGSAPVAGSGPLAASPTIR